LISKLPTNSDGTAIFNVGLMMFTAGATANNPNGPGGYVRFAMRPMDQTNKNALVEMIGDATGCNTTAPNSVTGVAGSNCILQNFNVNESSGGEKVGSDKIDYSVALYEAYQYFAGKTRYSGAPAPKTDPAAFSSPFTNYQAPSQGSTGCAKNYIIFVGNGFPNLEPSADAALLSGVGGSTTQELMPVLSTTSTTQNDITGQSCGTGNNNNSRLTNCTANIPASLKPAGYDTYQCIGTGVVDATVCPGANNRKFDVQASKTVFTVTFTDQLVTPTAPDNPPRLADEWTKFLNEKGFSSITGAHIVRTYAIDVFKDAQDARETALLYNMSKRLGGGEYYQASSRAALDLALNKALNEIQADNSVFAAASLPVSATNRAQNENQVFFGMFRPDAHSLPRWYGNLKRYQVGKDSGGNLILADKNGDNAIASSTGFFNPCAVSFWTTDTTSSYDPVAGTDASYWAFLPDSKGLCSPLPTGISPFSDLPDGSQVEKGGAAEVVRLGNNPPQDVTNATYAVNRTMLTCTDTSCTGGMVPFNTTNVSQTQLGVSTATAQENIVNYTLGQDVAHEKSVTGTSTRPSIHGDIVHSRPLPVNYGGSTGVVILYGANDGPFRAVRTSDGKELWSFVAPEHHAKLKRLLDNSPTIKFPNNSDTSALPKDYFFDGTPGLYQNADNSAIWIFPTMRRGGRMIYAFDITDPASPTLKWRVGCPDLTDDTGCTTGLSAIGQTWSTPNVAKIKGYNSGNDPVLVVGGGYDACEDEDTATPSCSSAKGRKVFVIDANTGAKVTTGFDGFTTDRSVSADVALVDRDFDGFPDAAYVVDLGGNLYRIDFVNQTTKAALAPADWTMTKIAHTESSGHRKFMFAPAVLPSSDRVFVTFGSGDRERPLITNYPYTTPVLNRFYMFMDLFTGADVDLDSTALGDITSGNLSPCLSPTSSLSGWRMDLVGGDPANPKVGEQTVTSSLILGGNVFFNTNRPVAPTEGQCSANLGEARGYSVSLLCGAAQSVKYTGGGLPISPVQGTTTLSDNSTVTFCIGCGDTSGLTETNPFTPGKVKPVIAPVRSRIYWYRHGDK
ncbi:MAG TPA: PilC/PilY family type IV pilus protein, partial [Burkholderiales bacterium]|nr:PilC/PilY family type IV pilus protein [Burkholderiales bacterium]